MNIMLFRVRLRFFQNLETKNKDKIKSLCEERNKQELIYEKIISYEIPVRHRVFLSPYTLKTDKYGIGPLAELGSYRDPEVLYSTNPKESIENIRNDEERIERLEKD